MPSIITRFVLLELVGQHIVEQLIRQLTPQMVTTFEDDLLSIYRSEWCC